MGLPPYTAVEPWIERHPERILAAQRAFVQAGSTDLLTATFGCLPERHGGWRALRDRAVGIARDAGARRVWLALGPLGDPAPVARGAAVDGVVLETHLDPARCAEDVRRVRAVWDGLLVGSLVPAADGEVRGGTERAAIALRSAGVDAVGFNCAPPDAVIRAVQRVPDGIDVWAKPNGTGPPDVWSASLVPLVGRTRWLGGCCGAGPEHVRALASAVSAPGRG